MRSLTLLMNFLDTEIVRLKKNYIKILLNLGFSITWGLHLVQEITEHNSMEQHQTELK